MNVKTSQAICIVACVMLALVAIATCASAQCITNPDGTITCPVLAPPLPVVQAAAADATPTAADRLTLRERRAMGFTRVAVIRATMKLARSGELPSTKGLSGADLEAARAEVKEAIAAEIMGENIAAWKTSVKADRDWSAFFESFIAFLEKLMPLILQLIDMFGGLAQDAVLTPTFSLADAVPIGTPPIGLAA